MEQAPTAKSTGPAEIIVAHSTLHMRTAATFLDQCPALGTVSRFHTNEALLPLTDSLIQRASLFLSVIFLSAKATRALVAILA